jgi:hypothetical protein
LVMLEEPINPCGAPCPVEVENIPWGGTLGKNHIGSQ